MSTPTVNQLFLAQKNGFPTWLLPIPLFISQAVLAANTQVIVPIPTGATYVIFEADTYLYAGVQSAFTIPGASVTDGSVGAVLNPPGFDLGVSAQQNPGPPAGSQTAPQAYANLYIIAATVGNVQCLFFK